MDASELLEGDYGKYQTTPIDRTAESWIELIKSNV